ncbi:MAG: hypothetical protein HRT61_02970 [Ekhidna sp.]|nr:hypothetical protein [Ekhidna sp.]
MKNTNSLNKAKSRVGIALVLSFTLGLAPFFPEPHLWGKLKWIAGGGEGMEFLDYFDLVLHASPWVFLIFEVIKLIRK